MYPFFALNLAAKPVYFSLVQTLFHFPTHYTVNAFSGYPILLFLVIMAKCMYLLVLILLPIHYFFLKHSFTSQCLKGFSPYTFNIQ